MHRNDGPNPGPGSSFVAGDPQTSTPGTVPAATYMTELMEELCGLVETSGYTLTKGNATQVLEAVRAVARGQRKRKNVLVNSDYAVGQRVALGLPKNLTAGLSAFNADRWIHSPGTGTGVGSSTRYSGLPVAARILTGGARYGLEIAQTTGGTVPYLEQRIEHVWTLEGRVCTFSLFADVFSLGSGTTLAVQVEVTQHFGSGGSPDVVTAGPTFTIPLAGSDFVRYSGQITLPSVSGKTIAATGHYVSVKLKFPSALTFGVDLTALQFEEGSVATAYELRPMPEEWADCQRFYQATGDAEFTSSIPGAAFSHAALKVYAAGTDGRPLDVRFPVAMRKIPTVVWYAPSNGAINSVDWEAAVRAVTAQFEPSTLGPGYPRVGSARALSALEAHYTADAEF
jgi:hypothetical protein